MSSSAIPFNTLPARESGDIASALGEVVTAFRHLASALLRTVSTPAAAATQPQTAFEEAEQLRSYAAGIQAQDPDFAQDLFAAADRHEIEAATAR